MWIQTLSLLLSVVLVFGFLLLRRFLRQTSLLIHSTWSLVMVEARRTDKVGKRNQGMRQWLCLPGYFAE